MYQSARSGGAARSGRDNKSARSSHLRPIFATPLDWMASLMPAAYDFFVPGNRSCQSNGSGRILSYSHIFTSPSNLVLTSAAAVINAGSRDSFVSALHASYTPVANSWSKGGDRKRKTPSSSLRRALAGENPCCQSLRKHIFY